MWVRNTGALVQGHLVSWGVRIREGFPEEAIQLRSEVTKRDRALVRGLSGSGPRFHILEEAESECLNQKGGQGWGPEEGRC